MAQQTTGRQPRYKRILLKLSGEALMGSEDFGIDPSQATRDLLAAKNMKDLVDWSGGLYNPPAKFRNW